MYPFAYMTWNLFKTSIPSTGLLVLDWIESYGLIRRMKLTNYLKPLSPMERADFALEVGTTVAHLNNVKYGLRTASAALTRSIATRTGRQVAEWDLRPDDWWKIWPELISLPDAPIVGDHHQTVYPAVRPIGDGRGKVVALREQA